MIEFEPEIKNARLLRRTVRWAERNKNPIPSLSDLARKTSVEELKSVSQSWRQAGLGNMIEASQDGDLSVHFVLNDAARAKVRELDQQSWLGRVRTIPIGKGAWEIIKLALAAIAGAAAKSYFG